MGVVVGETFEDTGTEPEYTVSDFRAYERLSGGRVRLYLTEERRDGHVLQYTAVVPITALVDMGRKCLEIAGQLSPLPEWALEVGSKIAS